MWDACIEHEKITRTQRNSNSQGGKTKMYNNIIAYLTPCMIFQKNLNNTHGKVIVSVAWKENITAIS
jgi:hypothetical protein